MKKAFVFILAIFYISIASGVTVNLHYCMGHLASVDYGHENEEGSKCAKCGMPDDNNACCHTDTKLIKLQDDHQLSALAFKWKQPEAIQVTPIAALAAPLYTQQESRANPIHSPPPDADPLYLYHCVFRI